MHMIPSTERFSDRVDYYVRARPKYPAALLRFFQSQLHLSPAHVVADIGSGTGFLTELFVRNGNQTYAVEPNGPMRQAAEQYLGEWPNFHSITATAESTTLDNASIDFVTAGQAFHWFDPAAAAREFARILRPRGVVALVWNERVSEGSGFMAAYDQTIEKFRLPDESARARLKADNGEQEIRKFFGSHTYQTATFDNPQLLDREGLIDRIVSSSNMPLPNQDRHAELLQNLHALFDTHQQNQSIAILHETRVYYGVLHG
jgi:SAM-dependent methyltransferase